MSLTGVMAIEKSTFRLVRDERPRFFAVREVSLEKLLGLTKVGTIFFPVLQFALMLDLRTTVVCIGVDAKNILPLCKSEVDFTCQVPNLKKTITGFPLSIKR